LPLLLSQKGKQKHIKLKFQDQLERQELHLRSPEVIYKCADPGFEGREATKSPSVNRLWISLSSLKAIFGKTSQKEFLWLSFGHF
jgi:hypothetical protein